MFWWILAIAASAGVFVPGEASSFGCFVMVDTTPFQPWAWTVSGALAFLLPFALAGLAIAARLKRRPAMARVGAWAAPVRCGSPSRTAPPPPS
ncbi:hypothetical protein ACFXJ8_08150 [Nonomuraea sp. NPDC059194]|uniref:hypothetical protein n=1 Tax=Nonomuraea sp. NPDC059194 TaxID=3346764 RepID=UPI0036CC8F54